MRYCGALACIVKLEPRALLVGRRYRGVKAEPVAVVLHLGVALRHGDTTAHQRVRPLRLFTLLLLDGA